MSVVHTPRLQLAIALSGIYLLLVAAAFIYAAASGQKFAGLVAVFLALPWFDYLPINPPAPQSQPDGNTQPPSTDVSSLNESSTESHSGDKGRAVSAGEIGPES